MMQHISITKSVKKKDIGMKRPHLTLKCSLPCLFWCLKGPNSGESETYPVIEVNFFIILTPSVVKKANAFISCCGQ